MVMMASTVASTVPPKYPEYHLLAAMAMRYTLREVVFRSESSLHAHPLPYTANTPCHPHRGGREGIQVRDRTSLSL